MNNIIYVLSVIKKCGENVKAFFKFIYLDGKSEMA